MVFGDIVKCYGPFVYRMDMQGSKEVDIIATVTKGVSMAVNHMPVAILYHYTCTIHIHA